MAGLRIESCLRRAIYFSFVVFLCPHCGVAVCIGNEPVANPETSGEDTSDSEDETPANGPAAAEHVCLLIKLLLTTLQFQKVCKDDSGYIIQLKQQKSKKVILLSSTSPRSQCANK